MKIDRLPKMYAWCFQQLQEPAGISELFALHDEHYGVFIGSVALSSSGLFTVHRATGTRPVLTCDLAQPAAEGDPSDAEVRFADDRFATDEVRAAYLECALEHLTGMREAFNITDIEGHYLKW